MVGADHFDVGVAFRILLKGAFPLHLFEGMGVAEAVLPIEVSSTVAKSLDSVDFFIFNQL